MKTICRVLYPILALSVIAGCVTAEPNAAKTSQMLNDRLGKMTWEEALQRFGPPTQVAESGNTKTAVWASGGGGTVFMPLAGTMVAAPVPQNTARLTFTSGRLSNWQLTGRWE